MHVSGIPAVIGVIRYGFKRSPGCLKVIDLYIGPKSGVPLPEGGSEAVGGMGGTDDQGQSHFVHRNRILDLEDKFGLNLSVAKRPLNLATAQAVGKSSVRLDQIGLVEAQIKGLFQAYSRYAIFSIIGRNNHLVAESKFGKHDRKVFVDRPIENARAVGKGEAVRAQILTGTDEGQLVLNANIFVPKEKETMFLFMGFVKDDETSGGLGPVGRRNGQEPPITRASRDHWQR